MTRHTQRSKPVSVPSRAAVYHRVSSEEQVEGYSLDAQQRATRAYCAAHGWEVVREYRDEGRSARTDGVNTRPEFARMLDDAEAGRFEVVVVHKMDRFSRNRRVAHEAFDRLGKARVGFVSISEDMDFSSPSGQLMLTMLIGMSQFYSDNLSAETKKGKQERKRQGMYNGHLPFGTVKGDDGIPVPHPENHPGLVLAFELAAAGKTDREVAQALNAAGYRTNGNRGANPFSKDTVRVILQNRFYLGELPDGTGGQVPGKHEAVIDPELFARAQAARRRNLKPRWTKTATRSPWALSGIATCGRCGKPIVADGHRRVCCAGRSQGNGCTEPSYLAHIVEDQLHAYLAGFAVPEAEQDRLLAAWRRSHRQGPDTAAARRRLEQTRDRVKELYLAGAIDKAKYESRTRAAEAEMSLLPSGAATDDGVGRTLAGFLADVPAAWAAATPDERNRLARQLFGQVVIANRTAVAIVPRPDLRPFFETIGPEEKSRNAASVSPEAAPGQGSRTVNTDTELAEVTGVTPMLAPFDLVSSWSHCRRGGEAWAPPAGRPTPVHAPRASPLRRSPPSAPKPTGLCASSPLNTG